MDVCVLGTLVAIRQHYYKYRTTLDEIHPIAGSVVDPQFADGMANRFDIAKVPIGHAIQSRRDASPGPSIAQATKPGVEGGGFDQLEQG